MTLRFGTAGLRGQLGEGPDRMNVSTVVRATDAVARWLSGRGADGETVVVGRDGRHGSDEFAIATAEVFTAHGFSVVALPDPGPTPLVAFATRALRAAAGVMITASHNPATDNGYKLYLGTVGDVVGAQLVSPADEEIEALMRTAPDSPARSTVAVDPRAETVVASYLQRIEDRFAARIAVPGPRIRIALTAMHGVGGALAVQALRRAGFDDVWTVDSQHHPDPDFPSVRFPNPELPGATDALLDTARAVGADLAIALDPDADRCALALPDAPGSRTRWRVLTGDETGALLGTDQLDEWTAAHNRPGPAPVIASSIVSGTLLDDLVRTRGGNAVRTLTGFKWLVRAGEPLCYAYEEAIGHCVDPDAVRDKDGISAAVAVALLARACAAHNSSLGERLGDLQREAGVHVSAQRSLTLPAPADAAAVLDSLRDRPPHEFGGIEVSCRDFAQRSDALATDGVEFTGADPTGGRRLRVFVRPSGTEPKLKYYGELAAAPGGDVDADYRALTDQLANILDDLLATAETPEKVR